MKSFSYHQPKSLEEALGLLGGASRPFAGGTDLLTLMKADLAAPERLVDVKRLLPRAIEQAPDGLWIGAAATLADVEGHAELGVRYTALAQAAALAASPQLRNQATVGGNLLQRPRCWYFRDANIPCWLKGAQECPAREGENRLHALFGGGPCYAVHPSDLAPALLAFDADVRLRGPGGEASRPLQSLFALPEAARRSEHRLGGDELLLGLRLARPVEGTRSTYLKAMDRASWAFALVGVAVVMRVSKQSIAHARVVLGGVAPVPWRAEAAERVLVGAEANADTFAKAAEAALQEAAPLRHNAYKMPLARALLRRVLATLAQ